MNSILDKFLIREKHVCPWYCCFTFDNIFRRLVQKPENILKGAVQPGMTALDIGSGMGYFSIPMAEMVGPEGKILALDVQEKMLIGLKKRAVRNGVEKRIECRLVKDSVWGISDELVSNVFAQAGKCRVPAIVFACDTAPELETEAPKGMVKVYPRPIDLENTAKLRSFGGVTVVSNHEELEQSLAAYM